MKSQMTRAPCVLAALSLIACGGGQERGQEGAPPAESAPVAAAPVAAPTGPVDQALADRGKTVFQTRGCIGCHTIGGGKHTGPDLKGVTERREFGWLIAMVTNPDSMLKADPVARQLMAEYMTPMINMNVSREEARAVFEYLRRGTP